VTGRFGLAPDRLRHAFVRLDESWPQVIFSTDLELLDDAMGDE
jgi:hypothetical protein